MDLLGGTASIPQVLQPSLAFHAPLAHLEGHITSCAQGSEGADKEQPLLQPSCKPETASRMTDWPPGWHPHPDCPAIVPQAIPDTVDLPMAGEPQLPAGSPALPVTTAAEGAIFAGVHASSNGLTTSPPPQLQPASDQEMPDVDAARPGGGAGPSRKRSAAEMQSENNDDGLATCGSGPCAAGPDAAAGSGCLGCRGEGRLLDALLPAPDAAASGNNLGVGSLSSSGNGSGLESSSCERLEEGGGVPPPDEAAVHGERQASEPGLAVDGGEAGPATAVTNSVGPSLVTHNPDAAVAEGGLTVASADEADGVKDSTPGAHAVNTAGALTAASEETPVSGGAGPPGADTAAMAGPAAAAGAAATDTLAMELRQIMARCGGVSDTRHAGRLAALVEGEERLGGRVTLLSVVQQSSYEVLRLFVQGTGLRSLERWVIQFRDEMKHPALIKVIGCLKILPIDLNALKGSGIGQTVGKLRKHTNPGVRAAASELVDHWKSVVELSVGKGEARQGAKSKPDGAAQDGPNKRPRKQADTSGQAVAAAGGVGAPGKHGDGTTTAAASSAPSTSKLAVMDDELFVSWSSGGSGSGGSSSAHPPGQHRPLGLTSFISGAKKVHAVKLENLVPSRLGGSHGAGGVAGTAGAAATAAGTSGTGEEGGSALPSPTSPRGDGVVPVSEAGDAAPGPDSPKPPGDGAASSSGGGGGGSGSTPSLLPLAGGDAASSAGLSTASGTAPKTVTLPRLGTLAGPGNPTVRLGSLRDGSLPTSGIGRLGAAAGVGGGGIGGRAGAAASLPAAVAPGGPQSAHARAMAARARAPSPEPAPRKEKKKTVSWAGDDALASYRLFKKDDPPQAAANDAVLTAEDEAAAGASDGGFGGPGGPSGPAGLPPPPGFQSAARREHASERMALIAQHQQEEQERQQELERWAAMRPTVPWVEPPELYLASIAPQQLPARGEDSMEREAQALLRMHTPRTVYYSPSQIPPSPAEPPPEPEPDFYRVRHIPLNVPGTPQMAVGAPGPGAGPPPHHAPPPQGMMQPAMYPGGPAGAPPPHSGIPLPMPYGGQLPPQIIAGGPPQQQAPPPPQVRPGQPGQQSGPGAPLTLPPDVIASLPALISTLAQPPGAPLQQPGPQQPQPGGPGPLPGHVLPGAVPQGQPQPPPQGVLPPPPHQHAHPHPLPHPHARGPSPHGGSAPPPQPGQPLLGPPGGPNMGPPMRPLEYGMQQQPPPHGGPGPGSGRPGSRFEPAPGMTPGLGPSQGPGGPPPPPPRKDGQPTLMRPRRGDEPPQASGPGLPMGPAQHPHSHPHMMGPPRGSRHAPPPHHMQGGGGSGPASHGMGPSGGGTGPGPGPGGWAVPAGGGGPPPGPGMGGPPPSGSHAPSSNKVCAFFNTPSGCRYGEGCRFLHVQPQDSGPPYDNGPYSGGPGRSGMGMGRPGGGPPPGLPGAMRRR